MESQGAHPIKGVLAIRRITLTEFSPVAGCNPHTLGRVFNGHTESWPALRRRCAEALGMPEERLFRISERV